jgi:hypothetical protein
VTSVPAYEVPLPAQWDSQIDIGEAEQCEGGVVR